MRLSMSSSCALEARLAVDDAEAHALAVALDETAERRRAQLVPEAAVGRARGG
jgi:hypothetical protein